MQRICAWPKLNDIFFKWKYLIKNSTIFAFHIILTTPMNYSKILKEWGPSWPWSYGSWIYNYICNQCLSPMMLWVRTPVHGEVYSIQHYVIKVGGFLRVLRSPPPMSELIKYDLNWTEHILIGLENKHSTLAHFVRILHRVGWFIVLDAIFNNISVIWLTLRSVLLVEESGVPGENHRPLSHNVVSSTPRHERGFAPTTSLVIGTDCICNCKSSWVFVF
jgi:hypothetical protein